MHRQVTWKAQAEFIKCIKNREQVNNPQTYYRINEM